MRRMILFIVVSFALAVPVDADLLTCKDASGKTIYTDNPQICPGAKPFEPKGEVQTPAPVESPSRASAPASRVNRAKARERSEGAEAGEAARWKQKKLDKEQELATIESRRKDIREYVVWCNRGNVVTTRDKAGIKRTVPCADIRKEFDVLDQREARVRKYLDSELAVECRKAGCLPGWLR